MHAWLLSVSSSPLNAEGTPPGVGLSIVGVSVGVVIGVVVVLLIVVLSIIVLLKVIRHKLSAKSRKHHSGIAVSYVNKNR